MSAISLEGVRKEYPGGPIAVDGIDLEVAEGEFVVLLGPTGCGKTTILRLVAGLDDPTAGHIRLGGRLVDQVPAHDRQVAMVFQDFALYPHLSVAENIGFPLHHEISDHAEVTRRVAAIARLVGVEHLLNHRPEQLSGGQRQRVAMARAVVRRPAVFLLDEPLSNVDAAVRAELRGEIVSIARGLGVATLYVTHDQTEAMTMADRIVVLRRGRVQQIGPPWQVYADPQRVFVAAFVGTPPARLFAVAVYAGPEQGAVIDLGDQVLRVPAGDPRAAALAAYHTSRLTLGIRPEALTVVPEPAGAPEQTGTTLRGRVVHVEHLGNEVLAQLDIGAVPVAPADSQLEPVTPGALTETLVRPAGQRTRAATTRTRYGLSPAYEPNAGHPPPPGTLAIRVPLPGPIPGKGDLVAVSVDLDRIFLFGHSGERIRLPSHSVHLPPSLPGP
ncbi:MAG: ABC transporter ATP-binding protein [Micromonosporaceae bacterium]|nr:ABC transporter ATP-binding protein [Micromonosporaceae bacterium]